MKVWKAYLIENDYYFLSMKHKFDFKILEILISSFLCFRDPLFEKEPEKPNSFQYLGILNGQITSKFMNLFIIN